MRLFVTVCVCALMAVGCSKVPSQQSYHYSFQHKMQSAEHWENLAKKVVAKQVGPLFTESAPNKPESILGVYIEDNDGSAFGTAFQTYLTTELFDKSIPVSQSPVNAFAIEWSVQKVIHDGLRKNPGPPAGIFGIIAYSVGTMFGGDFYAYGDVPKTELLITVKIKNGNITYSRTTETLYINDKDTHNYWVLPDKNTGVAHSYVREGEMVCREPSDLEKLFANDSQSILQLNALIKEGKCAIMKKAYPVTVLEKKEKYSVIRADQKPHHVYVTTHESLGI